MRPDGRLMMSPTKVEYPETIVNSFNKDANWKEFYGEMIKEDPAGMPTPLGQSYSKKQNTVESTTFGVEMVAKSRKRPYGRTGNQVEDVWSSDRWAS
ncbi:hypothetical protein ACHAXM_000443 [Skeletonema potamos]